MPTQMSTNWRWTLKCQSSDWNKWTPLEAMTTSNQFKSKVKTWQIVSMKTTLEQQPQVLLYHQNHKLQWDIQETWKVKVKLLWAMKGRDITSIHLKTMSTWITFLQVIIKIMVKSRLQEMMISMNKVEIVYWARVQMTWKSTPVIIQTLVMVEIRPRLSLWFLVTSRSSSLEVSKGLPPRQIRHQRINLENRIDVNQ